MENHDAQHEDGELFEASPRSILTRVQRVAIFLMLLDDEEAAALMGRMDPDELELIGATMLEVGEIKREMMNEALEDFVSESASDRMPVPDRKIQVREMMERSLGPTKAESMMLKLDPEPGPRSLEMARWLAPSVLLQLVEDEHPQVIAALLLMLEPVPAAEVLSNLPATIQSVVVEKVATMGPVSQQAIDMIDKLLSQRIGASFGPAALTIGGAKDAAALINAGAGDLKGSILPAIAQRNAPLAERIEEELFTFEMLLELDAKTMGRVLRDVDSDALIDALKGIEEDERDVFFRCMSSRAADGIKDEIEMRQRLSKKDVEDAQRTIVQLARQLAEQGEIDLGGGDGEFI
ncbi:MAG: FliG C-terminal domain-containing protein [Erythrobacter sp.]|uniref:flagellar motor switch protein FliG n=1 Tax=Erythrobacter sp. TaxID=1042 RepID=UPI003264DCE5